MTQALETSQGILSPERRAAYVSRRDAAVAAAREFHAEAGTRRGVRLTFAGPLRPVFEVYDLADLGPGKIVVKNLLSGVSAGTEGKIARGETPESKKAGEKVGYQEVGEADMTDDERVPPHSLIASNTGRKTVAEGVPNQVVPGKSLFVTVPGETDPALATDVAQMGGVANNGLAVADTHFFGQEHFARQKLLGKPLDIGSSTRGQNVLVIGAGMVGLEAAMFLQQAGANVAVADPTPERLVIPRALGMKTILSHMEAATVAASQVKDMWRNDGQPGADMVFECSGRLRGGTTALMAVRKGGPVINLSYYKKPDMNNSREVAEAVEWVETYAGAHTANNDLVTAQIGLDNMPVGLTRLDLARQTQKLVSDPRYVDALTATKTDFVPFNDFGVVVDFLARRDASGLDAFRVHPEITEHQHIIMYPTRDLLPLLSLAS